MAADDDTQDAVHRTLKERPPEDLPAGAEDRLRQRLDEDSPKKSSGRKTREPPTASRRPLMRPHDRARRPATPKASSRKRK